MYICIYMYIYIYTYMYICVCMCMQHARIDTAHTEQTHNVTRLLRTKRDDSQLERITLIINAIHQGSSRHLDSGVDDVEMIESVEPQTCM